MEPNPYEAPKAVLPPSQEEQNETRFVRKLVVALAFMVGLMIVVSIIVYALVAVAAVIALSGR
jgi:hypothetical protein